MQVVHVHTMNLIVILTKLRYWTTALSTYYMLCQNVNKSCIYVKFKCAVCIWSEQNKQFKEFATIGNFLNKNKQILNGALYNYVRMICLKRWMLCWMSRTWRCILQSKANKSIYLKKIGRSTIPHLFVVSFHVHNAYYFENEIGYVQLNLILPLIKRWLRLRTVPTQSSLTQDNIYYDFRKGGRCNLFYISELLVEIH